MNIYFIQCEALPMEGASFSSEYGGAYISGWVKAQSFEAARAIFTNTMQEADWNPNKIIEEFLDNENNYSGNIEGLERFNQAKLDGEVYQIDAWSIEESELHRKH